MKKRVKILIAVIGTPVLLSAILLLTYIIINRQGIIEPFQLGNSGAENRILIASQGSDFKNNLLDTLVFQLKSDENFLSMIDCTELGNENDEEWDAVIIIHTLQIHNMPEAAEAFLSGVKDLSKVILISTSGAGDESVENFNVDAVSTASRLTAIDPIMDWLIPKLEKILETCVIIVLNSEYIFIKNSDCIKCVV